MGNPLAYFHTALYSWQSATHFNIRPSRPQPSMHPEAQPPFLELWPNLWDPRPMLLSQPQPENTTGLTSWCFLMQNPSASKVRTRAPNVLSPTCHFMARDILEWLPGTEPSQGHSHIRPQLATAVAGVWWGPIPSCNTHTHRPLSHPLCLTGSCALKRQQCASSR